MREKERLINYNSTINSLFAAARCPHYRRASGEHYRYKNIAHIFVTYLVARRSCMSFLLFVDGWPLNLTVAKN